MKIRSLATVLAALLTSCGQVDQAADEPPPEQQPVAAAASARAENGEIVTAAFWTDPAAGGRDLVVAAAGSGGVDFFLPDATRAGNYAGVAAGFVSVLDAVAVGGETAPLIVVYDPGESTINAYRLHRESFELLDVMTGPLAVGDELTGLCQ
jgi:hypothetical protein